jgi:hypothetical protein
LLTGIICLEADNINNRPFFVDNRQISVLFRIVDLEFSPEDSFLDSSMHLVRPLPPAAPSRNFSARRTALAVWIPKKMYRISFSFFLALTCHNK